MLVMETKAVSDFFQEGVAAKGENTKNGAGEDKNKKKRRVFGGTTPVVGDGRHYTE